MIELTRTSSRRIASEDMHQRKCTEPVAPSSGFPTDRRRSDCRSESHQPRTLRTRCIAHSRERLRGRQGVQDVTSRKLRSFLFTMVMLRPARCALPAQEKKKRPGAKARPQEFAEPGTLSSTFPTNLPLPRSAPRGASSYRRPVLGAGRNLWPRTCPVKGVRETNLSQFAGGRGVRAVRCPARLGSRPMRDRARAVVVGGGVGGCAILYWLARLGWDDVVLVERADLTSGSTFHSAGLVGQLRSSLSLTRMMMDSVDLYRSLAAEVGLETGWREVGSLRLASSDERLEEITRQAGWAKTFGLPFELISPAQAHDLFPPMALDGVLGAAFLPTDGYVDPSQLTFALAEGARRRGAEVSTSTRVTGMRTHRGRVQAVETDRGTIETDVVVNAGGMYAREIGALVGVVVPIVPMAHEYLVLEPSGLPLDMPTMRDPSLLVYFRPESGGLIMGGYERNCAPWSLDGIPADFNGKLLEEDWPRFEELMQNAIVRVPALEEMGVVKLINGPEAFTPDGEFILGPSELRGFWVAAGFCAHGLAGAGGMGKLVAEWIVEGTPSLDVWHMDSRRFGAAYRSQQHTLVRTKEIYETYYDVKYPGHERRAGRPLRVSAAYPRLAELGAVFGEKSGWERANWFEPNAAAGDETVRPRGWAGKLWSPAIGVEHRACREAAGLFDETSFAKIEVLGRGAGDFLEGLCDNGVARDV